MRQRAADIGDIRTRMLVSCSTPRRVDLAALPEGTVLVVHDLTPSHDGEPLQGHVCAIPPRWRTDQPFVPSWPGALEVPAVLACPVCWTLSRMV